MGENYSTEYDSWEPSSSIPPHIIKYFEEDTSRLGNKISPQLLFPASSLEEEYEVEKILEKRGAGKKVEFLVKWKNWDGPDGTTWEPIDSLEGAADAIKNFENEQKDVAIAKEEVYEVENILEKRMKGKNVEYLVKWKNYDKPSDNTWEPASSLDGALDIITKFEQELNDSLPKTDEIYEVEKILEKRGKGKKTEYL